MKITKPICFFDLESTGIDTNKDRIVQIAMITINPDGTSVEKDVLINPEIPIPLEAAEIHGITDEMIKDAPKFKQIAKSLVDQLEGCDLGGFNSDSYDVNFLMAEMERAGVEFSLEGRNLVDVMKLYRILYPNTLSEIYKRLIGEELEGAHDALVDVKATKAILDKILPEDLTTPEEIDLFCQGDKKRVDAAGKIYEDEKGEYRWNFSKNKDELVTKDIGFCNWLLGNDFPNETKNKVRQILKPKEDGKK